MAQLEYVAWYTTLGTNIFQIEMGRFFGNQTWTFLTSPVNASNLKQRFSMARLDCQRVSTYKITHYTPMHTVCIIYIYIYTHIPSCTSMNAGN